MLKLIRAPNLMIGQHWVNVLAIAGIACELQNRYLNGALGDIPADQCAPELWLIDERDLVIAKKLIEAAARGPASDAPAWRCGHCGEILEAQFTVCWQCGTARNPLDG